MHREQLTWTPQVCPVPQAYHECTFLFFLFGHQLPFSRSSLWYFYKVNNCKVQKANDRSLDFSHRMFWESEVEFRLGLRRKEREFTEEMEWGGEILLQWRGAKPGRIWVQWLSMSFKAWQLHTCLIGHFSLNLQLVYLEGNWSCMFLIYLYFTHQNGAL